MNDYILSAIIVHVQVSCEHSFFFGGGGGGGIQ